MSDFSDLKDKNFSHFGKGISIEGELKLEGIVRISSLIKGRLIHKSKDTMTLESSGEIHGEVECHNFDIYGTFEGRISSKGTVSIYPSAKVSGEILCHSISIYPGADVNINGQTTLTMN